MRAKKKLRPAVKTHGGKCYLARRFLRLFPGHRTYVEPYAGGLSILLNKLRAPVEVAGDLNADLMVFYVCLRDRPDELITRVRAIPYTRKSFEDACGTVDHPRAKDYFDAIERATAFLVKNRFSRGGLGRDYAWSGRLRGGQPGDANSWDTIRDELPAIADRLQGVELYHGPALDLIKRRDSPETLFYLDPPYVHEGRTARNTYAHEMSNDDHAELLDAISDVQGMVILSGYHNRLYDDALESWKHHEFRMPNHAGQTKVKTRRVEVLWMNPACGRFALT
jgi:DNA adenine methylase